jgi:hypothetical protein
MNVAEILLFESRRPFRVVMAVSGVDTRGRLFIGVCKDSVIAAAQIALTAGLQRPVLKTKLCSQTGLRRTAYLQKYLFNYTNEVD